MSHDPDLAKGPIDMADVPAWVGGLQRGEFESNWVAAIVEIIQREPCSVAALAMALAAVRDRYRGYGNAPSIKLPADSPVVINVSLDSRSKLTQAQLQEIYDNALDTPFGWQTKKAREWGVSSSRICVIRSRYLKSLKQETPR